MKHNISTISLAINTLFSCMLLIGMASMESAYADSVQATKSPSNEIVLAPNSPQLTNLKIEPVIEVTAPVTDPLNGKIIFDENHTSRISSSVLGRAIKINVQIGDKVKAGQILLVMDSPDLGSALADARKADADLVLKKQANERSRMLLEGGVIAQKDFEGTQADLAQSQAEAQRARARLNNLGAGSNNPSESYTLRSPISGMVVDRQANPGSEIRPDATAPLFTITDPNYLWATIDLPERDLGKVSLNQPLSIEVDAYPDEIFTGRVLSIGAMVDPTTRRITVRCAVDGKGKLKPEMYARITPLSSANTKVIRLPNTAMITEGLYNYVFVETSPGHIVKKRVSLNSQGRDFSTVKEGLNVGDRLVTVGAILLNSELASGK